MKLPTLGRDKPFEASAPMTPLIDVVFQLLVYFLCTASFNPPEFQLPANLPATGIGQPSEPPPELQELELIELSLRRENHRTTISLNGEPVAGFAELERKLRALAQLAALPVIFDPAPDVPIADMVKAYDLCLLVGLTDIRFATRSGEP